MNYVHNNSFAWILEKIKYSVNVVELDSELELIQLAQSMKFHKIDIINCMVFFDLVSIKLILNFIFPLHCLVFIIPCVIYSYVSVCAFASMYKINFLLANNIPY